jgi:hypothetical protein
MAVIGTLDETPPVLLHAPSDGCAEELRVLLSEIISPRIERSGSRGIASWGTLTTGYEIYQTKGNRPDQTV